MFSKIFNTIITPLIGALILLSAASSYADIYGYQDKQGRWHFPDLKADKTYRLALRAELIKDYGRIIEQASKTFGIEPSFVKAVIKAESDFNSRAVSQKGARGLMQLMPDTARVMEVKNPLDPEENIFGGTRYLSRLLTRYSNDKVLTLAAYNAGPEKVAAYKGVPPFPETKTYISRVMRYYKAYHAALR